MSTPIEECRFNMYKGMWETCPDHWIHHVYWIMVAFPFATTLERGVSP